MILFLCVCFFFKLKIFIYDNIWCSHSGFLCQKEIKIRFSCFPCLKPIIFDSQENVTTFIYLITTAEFFFFFFLLFFFFFFIHHITELDSTNESKLKLKSKETTNKIIDNCIHTKFVVNYFYLFISRQYLKYSLFTKKKNDNIII